MTPEERITNLEKTVNKLTDEIRFIWLAVALLSALSGGSVIILSLIK